MLQTFFLDLGIMEYRQAHTMQLELVKRRINGDFDHDIFLFTEHPAVFTLGRRGGQENIKVSEAFLREKGVNVIPVERGGNITFHGPGQVVVYPVIALKAAGLSITEYIFRLEEAMLRLCWDFGADAQRDARNHGVWAAGRKLGSIGIALRHGVAFHGLALNVNTDLEAFSWVRPCGLDDVGMTSLARMLDRELPMEAVKGRLAEHLQAVFKREFLPLPHRMEGTGNGRKEM